MRIEPDGGNDVADLIEQQEDRDERKELREDLDGEEGEQTRSDGRGTGSG